MPATAAKTRTAQTVPSLVLPLIRPTWTDEELAQAGEAAGRALGARVELDAGLLDALEGGLGSEALAYWEDCRAFWDRISQGYEADGLLVKRELVAHRQVDCGKVRVDLGEVLSQLLGSEMGALVDMATGTDPDWVEVDALLGSRGSRTTDGNSTLLTVAVSARQEWSEDLGGRHSRGELTRVFELCVSHAPWRDRRMRRLVSVRVCAVELWPVPQGAHSLSE